MPGQDKDYTTAGMTEREMRSRIKSHREMAYKAAKTARENKVPEAFLSDSFRTWYKNNPQSPFVKGGGIYKLQDQAGKSISAHNRYVKKTNTALKITKALNVKKAQDLQKQINKLVQGY
jgi:hypothetical protein|tara:strand:- start:2777 stop:3133 length:357 start_codon:yes stop_codon:yes gene_type:complete